MPTSSHYCLASESRAALIVDQLFDEELEALAVEVLELRILPPRLAREIRDDLEHDALRCPASRRILAGFAERFHRAYLRERLQLDRRAAREHKRHTLPAARPRPARRPRRGRRGHG